MDSFLIVSPWRSGSVLTSVLLNQYLSIKYGKKNVISVENNIIKDFIPQQVYHAHNLYNATIVPEYFTVVRNKRDIVDCVISSLVARKTSIYVHFNNQKVDLGTDNIVIDLKDFEKEVNSLLEYILKANLIFENIKHVVIEYNDIKDDLNNVYRILGIDFEAKDFSEVPTKVNLDYKTAIKNYSEIIDFAVSKNWR